MSLSEVLVENLERSFGLFDDLVELIDEEYLKSKLGAMPSNTVGEQLWCVVGARESYGRAIKADEWQGFACSLENTARKQDILLVLKTSAAVMRKAVEPIKAFGDVRQRLVVDLLEHEASHQGQLIRYLYGLRLPIPASWKTRFALADHRGQASS